MYEINLVPDVKLEMIKKQKARNLVFFICLAVAGAGIGITAVLGSIVGTQRLVIADQQTKIDAMSEKVNGYSGLSEFLTIQDQLGKISEINANKKVLSRVFNVLGVMLPEEVSGGDSVTLSELNINLDESTLTFDGQADAGQPDVTGQSEIDYRVLEAFKKSVEMSKYDYGRYVDAEGKEIPTWCMEDMDENGNVFSLDGSIVAVWHRGRLGCDPSRNDEKEEKEEEEERDEDENRTGTTTTTETDSGEDEVVPGVADEIIYRTPQFDKWYEAGEKNLILDADYVDGNSGNNEQYQYQPKMTLSGEISGVPHFESECIIYSGDEIADGKVRWTAQNEGCLLAEEGASIRDSSNGKDSSGNLVLRFNATIKINEEVFSYANKHMMAIRPGRQNVTDSYVQIQNMFEERARDCTVADTDCTAINSGGN